MNSKRSQEIDEIFQAALDLPWEQRAAYLDQACAGDETAHTVSISSILHVFLLCTCLLAAQPGPVVPEGKYIRP